MNSMKYNGRELQFCTSEPQSVEKLNIPKSFLTRSVPVIKNQKQSGNSEKKMLFE